MEDVLILANQSIGDGETAAPELPEPIAIAGFYIAPKRKTRFGVSFARQLN